MSTKASEVQATAPEDSKGSYWRKFFRLAWTLWPLLLGNIVEWYEFSVYGFMEHRIATIFFHGSKLGTWTGFAMTCITRPLGGLVLGWLADRAGRKLSLNISIASMMVATVGQGLLPTYDNGETWGNLGVTLLVVLKAVQGLSAGGEIGAIVSYIVELAPLECLGLSVSLISMTAGSAFLLSNAVVITLNGLLGDEIMLSWGWRLPFLLALVPSLAAAWGRKQLPESELLLKELAQQQTPATESDAGRAASPSSGGSTVASEEEKKPAAAAAAEPEGAASSGCCCGLDYRAVLLGIGGTAAFSVVRFVATLWVLAHLKTQGLPRDTALRVGVVANALGVLGTPFVGRWIDVHGVALVNVMSGVALLVTGLPVFLLLEAFPGNALVAYLGVGLGYGGALAVAGGVPQHLFVAELFPTAQRCQGLAISFNIGQSYIGGFGSLLAQAISEYSPIWPGVFMSSMGLVTILTGMWAGHLDRQGKLQVTHRRAQPYWGCSRDAKGAVIVQAAAPPAIKGEVASDAVSKGPAEPAEGAGEMEQV